LTGVKRSKSSFLSRRISCENRGGSGRKKKARFGAPLPKARLKSKWVKNLGELTQTLVRKNYRGEKKEHCNKNGDGLGQKERTPSITIQKIKNPGKKVGEEK